LQSFFSWPPLRLCVFLDASLFFVAFCSAAKSHFIVFSPRVAAARPPAPQKSNLATFFWPLGGSAAHHARAEEEAEGSQWAHMAFAHHSKVNNLQN
jgi:predicted secreted protein